jgi:flagellar biosynthesis regulator FlaF
MSDIVDDLIRLSEDPSADPRDRRRQTMERLIQTLLDMADNGIGPEEAQQRASIIHLTTIIGDMTGRIAQADDQTFSAIVREAAMLVRSLQRRQADATKSTVH